MVLRKSRLLTWNLYKYYNKVWFFRQHKLILQIWFVGQNKKIHKLIIEKIQRSSIIETKKFIN